MSTKAPRPCLTFYRTACTTFRASFAARPGPRTFRALSSTPNLSASRLPRASSTIKKQQGEASSFRTKKLAQGLIDQSEPWPMSIWGDRSWSQTQMVTMGIPDNLRWDVLGFMFHGQVYQESPKARAEGWQEQHGKKYGLPDKTSARMFRVVGLPLLREPKEGWQNFGVYMLECAVYFGDSLAALHLCALENRQARFRGGISQRARDMVADLASEGHDWRAVAIRAQYLMTFQNRPTKLDEAFELAQALIDMTEANTEREDEGPELIPLIEPWRVLWDIACLKDDAKTKIKAIEIGATQYNNPDACLLRANAKDVTVYSERWVDLVTKAAMGGSPGACYELGMYWLEKKGWYPCPPRQQSRRIPSGAESSVGFDWLEIAAAGRSPNLAAELFLGMALVCRENNYSDVGLGLLESAVDIIEVGLGSPAEKVNTVERLRAMIKDWSNNAEGFPYGPARGDGVFEDTKAANLLPPPRMPRYQKHGTFILADHASVAYDRVLCRKRFDADGCQRRNALR